MMRTISIVMAAFVTVATGCVLEGDESEGELGPTSDDKGETPYFGCWQSSTTSDWIYMKTDTWRVREKWANKGGRKVRAKGRGTNHPYSVTSETVSHSGDQFASEYCFNTECSNGSTFFPQCRQFFGVLETSIGDSGGTCKLGRTRLWVRAANC